jgi:hypothetical protein
LNTIELSISQNQFIRQHKTPLSTPNTILFEQQP